MEFKTVNLPDDIAETLSAIYKKAKRHNQELDKDTFLRQIIMEWLEPFQRSIDRVTVTRGEAILRNRLYEAIKISGKSQAQIAREIGVNRSYISELIKGKYDPSITVAYLLAASLGYPAERIKDLFYLEPTTKE